VRLIAAAATDKSGGDAEKAESSTVQARWHPRKLSSYAVPAGVPGSVWSALPAFIDYAINSVVRSDS